MRHTWECHCTLYLIIVGFPTGSLFRKVIFFMVLSILHRFLKYACMNTNRNTYLQLVLSYTYRIHIYLKYSKLTFIDFQNQFTHICIREIWTYMRRFIKFTATARGRDEHIAGTLLFWIRVRSNFGITESIGDGGRAIEAASQAVAVGVVISHYRSLYAYIHNSVLIPIKETKSLSRLLHLHNLMLSRGVERGGGGMNSGALSLNLKSYYVVRSLRCLITLTHIPSHSGTYMHNT